MSLLKKGENLPYGLNKIRLTANSISNICSKWQSSHGPQVFEHLNWWAEL
jgi:hypothetical protein